MREWSTFGRFALLYAALFAAFGAASPFLPAFLQSRGLRPGEIALVLGLGSTVRLVTGPLGGRVADRTGATRAVLALLLAASAAVACFYGPAHGLLFLAGVSVAHAAVLAPLTPLADALSVAASGPARFEYGWLRGAGSAAFIVGSAVSGTLIGALGIGVVVALNAGLLAAAAASAWAVPQVLRPEATPGAASGAASGAAASPARGSWQALMGVPGFVPLMAVAALVGGSHALHDSFGVIRWESTGMSARTAGVLWGESVAAEVLVFFLLGPALIRRVGPAGAAAISALAGVVRWSVTALTAAVPAMAAVEPLHGFTFALLHLAVMRVIAERVPAGLAATAQAFYGTIALGAGGTALTFASGPLYAAFGAGAFWVMAALCVAALPFAARLSGRRAAGMPRGELSGGRGGR